MDLIAVFSFYSSSFSHSIDERLKTPAPLFLIFIPNINAAY